MDAVLAGIRIALLAGGLLLLAPAMQGEAAISVYVDEAGTAHYAHAPAEPRHLSLPAFSDPPAANSVGGEYADLKAESNFDAFAVSRKGARGLMQLMPATADRYAVADVFDPEANIRGGIRYLRDLQDMFPGRLSLALAAYNAGQNIVLRYGGIPPYPETRQYVQRVLDLYARGQAAAEEDAGAGPPISPPGSDAAGAVAPAQSVFWRVDVDGTLLYTNLPSLPRPAQPRAR